jgi:enoyl reductase
MRRRTVLFPLLCLSVLASPLAGVPAATAGSVAGCSGNTCTVYLSQNSQIAISDGGALYSLPAALPMCWLEPAYTQQQMVFIVQNLEQVIKNDPSLTPAQRAQLQAEIDQVLQNPSQAGVWWIPDFVDTPAGNACVAGLPPWAWVATGSPPPPNGITPIDLARIAEAAIQIPPPQLVLSPQGKSYTNLPTFVWVNDPGMLSATATLQGYMSATVNAVPTSVTVDSAGGPAALYENCGPAGSSYPIGRPPASAGPYTTPDCGVVYQQPSVAPPFTFTMTVTVNWTATWVGNGVLDMIPMSSTATVPVAEIQSVNRGG